MLQVPATNDAKSKGKSPRRGLRDIRRKLSVFGTDAAIDGIRQQGQNTTVQVEDIPTQSFTPEPGSHSPPPPLSQVNEPSKSDISISTDFVAADTGSVFINLSMPTTNFTSDLTPFRSFAMSSRVGASMRGDKVNQDRPFSCVPFNGDARSAMFAVFDGHGFAGDANAQYLIENFERCLLSAIRENRRKSPTLNSRDSFPACRSTDGEPKASQLHQIVTGTKEKERRSSQDSVGSVSDTSTATVARQNSSSNCKQIESSPAEQAQRPDTNSLQKSQNRPDVSPSKGSSQKRNAVAPASPDTNAQNPIDSNSSHPEPHSSRDYAAVAHPSLDLHDSEAVSDMFTKGFATLEEDLTNNRDFDTSYSGSTCVCLLMHENVLYTANVGDSRAVLGRTKWYSKRTLKPVVLSRDHSPGIRAERRRIIEAGGRVHPTLTPSGHRCGPLRVWIQSDPIPGLAMSRSFGDGLAHSVGVIAVPEIKTFEVNPNGKDKLIVLGSDGLFEFMSNSEVVNMAFKCSTPAEACERLCDTARERWKAQEDVIDDITAIVIFFE